MVLFRGGARLLDQELELRTFAYIEIARLVLDDALKHRRTRVVIEPDDRRVLRDVLDHTGEPVDDRLWCACGRGKTRPRGHDDVWMAELTCGRHIRQRRQPLLRRHHERNELAGFDV